MDETYIKVKGQWIYLYRAVDKEGNTVDFMLSERRDEPAARAFFMKLIGSNGIPHTVTMDKSGANKAAIDTINLHFKTSILQKLGYIYPSFCKFRFNRSHFTEIMERPKDSLKCESK